MKKIYTIILLYLIGCGGSSPTSPPDPPIVQNINLSTDEDTSVDFTLTGVESEGLALTFSLSSQPNNGSVTLNGSNGTYVPNANYNGTDVFGYVASSTNGQSNVGTVTVVVAPVDDQPSTFDISASTNEDEAVNINFQFEELDGQQVTFSIANNPSNGTVTISGTTATYTPNTDWNGTDQFNFQIQDSSSKSILNTATATITVVPVNDAPVVSALSGNAILNQATDFTLQGSDIENSSLTYSIVSQPTNGSVTINGNIATYTATTRGTDSFTYKANDGEDDSNVETVSISITATTANFTVDIPSSSTTSFVPQRINFSNSSENATSFAWDFGDGNTSTEENPVYTYITNGSRTISLTVTGPYGSHTYSESYEVFEIPTSNAVYTVKKYIINNEDTEFLIKVNADGLASAEIEISTPSGVTITDATLPDSPLLADGGTNPLFIDEGDANNSGVYKILTSGLTTASMNSNGSGDLAKVTFTNSNSSSVEVPLSVNLLDSNGNSLTPETVINLYLIQED
jgi:PKD repeat protein